MESLLTYGKKINEAMEAYSEAGAGVYAPGF